MYTFKLPTTGYIILHVVSPDEDKEPYTVPTFIDCRNELDDAGALAHLRKELHSLRNAPSNVLHRMQLVHRTEGEPDRLLSKVEEVRGTGAPMNWR